MKTFRLSFTLFVLMLATLCCSAQSHSYVDLGLPSGTLWADRNVGAASPEDYGDYFAWGETTAKSNYDWSTYKYGNNGLFIDSLTTLERSDDAAYQNWGSQWCMPTQAQFQEFRDKCTWTWTTRNGKNGYEVKGKNGNTIFLPAAGYRDGTSLIDDGFHGYYWSSSLHTGSPDFGLYLYFNSGGVSSGGWSHRCLGFSVRPVRCR